MSADQSPSDLSGYLEASRDCYDACLDEVKHDLRISEKIDATLNLQFVRFSGTGEPKFRELAKNLVNHIIKYSISLARRKTVDIDSAARLFTEARDHFNLKPESGEPGELLLYFLMETVLKAPQLLCKIALKTNRSMEVNGADGIHARWDTARDKLILHVGESKLYGEFGEAVSDALASIAKLHDDKVLESDLLLTTQFYKQLDSPIKERIVRILDQQTTSETFDLVHTCLIGYDWSKYGDLTTEKRNEFISQFQEIYLKNVSDHRFETLQNHLNKFKYGHLSFYIFLLPFRSVAEFRLMFNEAMTTGAGT